MPSKSSRSNTSKRPWYEGGLQFECSQCGDCCSGAPGFVWVDEEEIDKLAARLEMERDAFERKFVRQVGARKSLTEYPDGDCIFLDPDTRGCSVYEDRPVQCRTWPFWDSNLASRKDWRETCRICPGSGTGRLYTFEEIEIRRREREV